MKMSNNKAAGEGGIANEKIKYDPEELHQELTNMLNRIYSKQIKTTLTQVNQSCYQYQSQTNRKVL